MKNFVHHVSIENFKSIKQLELMDCKRINLFIGKPNVGKSNILEALSLHSLSYAKYDEEKKNLHRFIRFENETELFFDGDVSEDIVVQLDDETTSKLHYSNGLLNLEVFSDNTGITFLSFDKNKIHADTVNILKNNPVKTYLFPSPYFFGKASPLFLLPPAGINLLKALEPLNSLRKELSEIFQAYGLKLTFDRASLELKLLKEAKNGEIFIIPFGSIADTLQRLIFYKTAIASNSNSILIFEEPESHSYPPYISKITNDIIQSETNQFFLTTHSPYVVTDFLERAIADTAIFLVDFVGGETVVRRLKDEELDEVYQAGVDLFFNIESYL